MTGSQNFIKYKYIGSLIDFNRPGQLRIGETTTVEEQEPRGAVYTRWGHNNCPGPQTRLVYSGYAGGAHFDQTGGAADYICLSTNVTQSSDRNKYTWFGYLYGAEYEFGNAYSEHNHDVPCAVCQSLTRTNFFMIPGTDICPIGWYSEYRGLLMSGDHTHKAASQHVCLDNARKSIHGGNKNENGKLFHAVRAKCGSLKCPPYKNDQLVTCAVCSR